MSAEANKALVRRFYEEIDKGNLAAMDELVAEDYMAERVDSEHPVSLDEPSRVADIRPLRSR